MKIDTVTVKRDFVSEVAKTLLEGFEVRVFAEKLVEETTVMIRVVKIFAGARPPIFSQSRIAARDLERFGVDSCYCAALEAARADLKRHL